MRNRFDRQLTQLNSELTEMGMYIEEAIAGAVEVVIHGDINTAKTIMESDEDIDHKERDIESLCMKMLLQQQPVARDLRKISSALKMITDMERIGDQAADICEIVVKGSVSGDTIPARIRSMAEDAIYMVTAAVEAYVKSDLDLAKTVIAYDEKVDASFSCVKKNLIDMIKENGDASAIDALMIAKYIEKIGDHAVNIAGWVSYSITGEHIK